MVQRWVVLESPPEAMRVQVLLLHNYRLFRAVVEDEAVYHSRGWIYCLVFVVEAITAVCDV